MAYPIFDGSACGVTLTVTVSGFGAAAGAVYVAESAVAFPPADCVVTTLNVPHDDPLHPRRKAPRKELCWDSSRKPA